MPIGTIATRPMTTTSASSNSTTLPGWLQQVPLAQSNTSGSSGLTREAMASLLSWDIFGAGVEWSRSERPQTVEGWAHDIVSVLVGGVARVVALPTEEPARAGRATTAPYL